MPAPPLYAASVLAHAMSPAVAITGEVPPDVGVRTVTVLLALETFPARSRALTVYVYVVFALTVVSE